MIQITMDKGRSSMTMEGTDKENFAEAIAIVNALYAAFRNDNPAMGAMFHYAVRHMDYVWEGGVITEAITIAIPNTGAEK